MPKPQLRWPFNRHEEELLETMLGPRATRHSYPQSESEMQGIVLALLAEFDFEPRATPLTLEDMVWTPDSYVPPEPPKPPDPPKPQPSDSRFAAELLAAMVLGLHDWRRDLDFPESHSDLEACALGVLSRFDFRPRATPFRVTDMAWPQGPDADSAVPSDGNAE